MSLAESAEARLAAVAPSGPGTRPSLATATESQPRVLRGPAPGVGVFKAATLEPEPGKLARGAWAPRWHGATCPSASSRTRDKQPRLVPKPLPSRGAVKPGKTQQGVQFQPSGWGNQGSERPVCTRSHILLATGGEVSRAAPQALGPTSAKALGSECREDRHCRNPISTEPRERPSTFHP